jgi:ABC-type thiamin/hydroxymethylpyrimidine transport system permease subunit
MKARCDCLEDETTLIDKGILEDGTKINGDIINDSIDEIRDTGVELSSYLWGMSLKDSIIVSLFGVLIALSSSLMRIPMQLPGHKGIVWMAILVTCAIIFKKSRAATLASFIAGFLVVVLFPSSDGFLEFFKFFIPGLTMDIMLLILPSVAVRWYSVAIIAALSHITKLGVNFVNGMILNLPLGFLTLGLKVAVLYHLAFGFIGGILGFVIAKRLEKHGYLKKLHFYS